MQPLPPHPLHKWRFLLAGPGGHGDRNRGNGFGRGHAELKGGAGRDGEAEAGLP